MRPAGGVMPLMRIGRADRDDADPDLHEADAEHIAAQLPQPRQRQFHAEQEQQEHDAEFGERLAAFGIFQRDVAQERVTSRRDGRRRRDRAARPIRRKPSTVPSIAVQQRHDDAGGDQEDQNALQMFGVQHGLRSLNGPSAMI